MHVVWRAQAFNCGDLIGCVHDGKGEARIHTLPIDMHGASAALPMVTALFGAGHIQILAKAIEQSRARIEIQRVRLSIDLESDWDTSGRHQSRGGFGNSWRSCGGSKNRGSSGGYARRTKVRQEGTTADPV